MSGFGEEEAEVVKMVECFDAESNSSIVRGFQMPPILLW